MKVLIISDNQNPSTFGEFLAMKGIKNVHYATVKDAQRKLHSEEFEGVIIDSQIEGAIDAAFEIARAAKAKSVAKIAMHAPPDCTHNVEIERRLKALLGNDAQLYKIDNAGFAYAAMADFLLNIKEKSK